MNKKRDIILLILLLIPLGIGIYYILEFDSKEVIFMEVEISNFSELPIDSVFSKTVDFKSEVIKFNKDTVLRFETNFKQGQVKQGSLDGYLTKNKDGFTIKLKRIHQLRPLQLLETVFMFQVGLVANHTSVSKFKVEVWFGQLTLTMMDLHLQLSLVLCLFLTLNPVLFLLLIGLQVKWLGLIG